MIVPNRFFIILIVFISFLATPVSAEFICRSEVQYKWRSTNIEKSSPKESAKADPQSTPTTPVASNDEIGVFWSVVERKGASEDEAKKLVADAAISQRVNADKNCRQQHENLASCVANKFTALSSTLNSLTFSARRALEEAVTSDCEKQQGTCLNSTVSDPVCVEKKVEEEKVEGGEKGEKEKGKKDKKK